MIFASGAIPLDPKSMQVVSGGIKEQTVSSVHAADGSGRRGRPAPGAVVEGDVGNELALLSGTAPGPVRQRFQAELRHANETAESATAVELGMVGN